MVAFAAAIPAITSAISAVGQVLPGLFNKGNKQADMGSLYNQILVSHTMNNDFQKDLMNYQYDLESNAQKNAYQNTVYSLKQAGLNPILATTNGATVPSISQSSANSDLASYISADASSAQAKIAKDQIKLNAMQTFADVSMKMTSSALTAEKAKTEKFVQDLTKSNTELNFLEKAKKEIENMYLPKQIESDIKYKLDSAKASLIQAQVAQMVAPSIISSNYTNSAANWKSAEANFINATQGSPTKAIIDAFSGFGVSPSGIGKYISNSFVDDWKRITGHTPPSDFDKKVYKYLENRYYNYFKGKYHKYVK